MRSISFVVIMGLFFALISPFALSRPYSSSQEKTSLLTLNVCDESGAGAVSGGDMPFLAECGSRMVPMGPEYYPAAICCLSGPLPVVFRKDHPPKSA